MLYIKHEDISFVVVYFIKVSFIMVPWDGCDGPMLFSSSVFPALAPLRW